MNPQRKLEAIAELAQALSVGWPMYESVEATLALPEMRSGSGDHRSSDVPDPVANIASSHERYYETANLTSEAFGVLREIQTRMSKIRCQHPDAADDLDAAAASARCTGVVGSDPLCTRNAVRNVTHRGAVEPTCWACLKREQRATVHQDPPLELTHDCGHSCCTQRHNPNHEHWKRPSTCDDCRGEEADAS